MNKVIKKAFSITVTVATIFWSMGLFALPMAQAQTTYAAGDLIKASTASVYYYAGDGKRYVFPNENTYYSWYSNFSAVKVISDTELASIQIGGNVTIRPGTFLVKVTTDPKVYAVEPGGIMRHVSSEAIATSLYGSDWNTKIVDVPDAFFTNYSYGSAISTAMPSIGSLIKAAGADDIYYIDAGSVIKRKLLAGAFDANRFQNKFVQTVSDSILSSVSSGTDISGAISSIMEPIVTEGGTTPVGTGSLMVAAAAGNPASATLLAGSSNNNLLKVKLSAGNAPVSVTGINLIRSGFSVDTNVTNATVKVMGASGSYIMKGNPVTFSENKAQILFTNSPISVPANGSVDVYIFIDLAAGATAGTMAISLPEGGVVSDAASASGKADGNLMTLTASAGLIGAMTVGVSSLGNPNVNLGDERTITRLTFTETSGLEDVKLYGLWKWTNIGSASDADYEVSLISPEGTVLATAVPKSNEILLDLGNSYIIKKGQSLTFELRVKIKSGSSRTVKLAIQNYYDMNAMGMSTGAGIALTIAGTSADTTFPIGDAAINTFTITAGTLTASKDISSPSGNIGQGSTDNVLAVIKLTASGEDIQLQRVIIDASNSTGACVAAANCLTGTMKLMVGDTIIYSVAANTATIWNGTTLTANLSQYITIPANGSVLIKIVGNVGSAVAASSTIDFGLSDYYYKRMNSLTFATASTGVLIRGNALTVVVATLNVAVNNAYGSQSTVAGGSEQKIGSVVLQTTTAEGINLSSMSLNINSVTNMTNLKIMYGAQQLGSTIAGPATTANSFSFSLLIPGNSAIVIDIYATIAAGASGTYTTTVPALGFVGVGAISQQSVNVPAAPQALQTLTISASGRLIVASGSPASAALYANQQSAPLTDINFRALNEGINISQIDVRVFSGAGNVDQLSLKDASGNVLKSAVSLVNGVASFGGLNITIGKNETKKLSIFGNVNALETITPNSLIDVFFGNSDATGVISGGLIAEEAITHELSTTSSIVQYNVGDVVVDSTAVNMIGMVTTAAAEGANLSATGITTALYDAAAAAQPIAGANDLMSKWPTTGSCVLSATVPCDTALSIPAADQLWMINDGGTNVGLIHVTGYTDVGGTGILKIGDTITGNQIDGNHTAVGATVLAAGDVVAKIPVLRVETLAGGNFSNSYAVGDVVAYIDTGTVGNSGLAMVTTAQLTATAYADGANDLGLMGGVSYAGVTLAATDKLLLIKAGATTSTVAQGGTLGFDIVPGEIFFGYDVGGATLGGLYVAETAARKGDVVPAAALGGLTLAAGDQITKIGGSVVGNLMTVHGSIVETALSATSPAFGAPIEEQEQLLATFNLTARGHSAYITNLGLSFVGSGNAHLTAANTIRVEIDGQSTTAAYAPATDTGAIVFAGDGILIAKDETKAFKVYINTAANSGSWATGETLAVQITQGNGDGFPGSGLSYKYLIGSTYWPSSGAYTIVNNISQAKGNTLKK